MPCPAPPSWRLLVGLVSLLAACSWPGGGLGRGPGEVGVGGLGGAPGGGPERLRARPRPLDPSAPATPQAGPGLQPIGPVGRRESLVYLPKGYRPDRPAPLVVHLHGAGSEARAMLAPELLSLADRSGFIVLAPTSAGTTWDVLVDRWGADAVLVNRLLEEVFDRFAVDPRHLALSGFSDGASYALGLGLANGDLFTHVTAFSPGFVPRAARRGRPQVFVAHGTQDRVLPIAATSRTIVPGLRRDGYQVLYREFEGPHTVPPEIAAEAVAWFLGEDAPPSSG